MKNGLLVVLLAAGFLLGMVPLASGGEVIWHVLEDPGAALRGPGPDGLIGVAGCPGGADDDDTSTGENNKCNFSSDQCANGSLPDPTNGSYSYGALEFNMAKSCLGGTNTGAPCDDDTGCPGGSCLECTDNPSGFDSYYYAGNIGKANGNGTMTICGESGTSSYEITSMKIGGSESAPGLGASCVTLQPGGPYTGSPCGVDQETSSTIDVKTSVLACLVEAGTVDNLATTGRSYDVDDPSPDPVCNYSTDDILCLLDVAKTLKGAAYLLISCSDQVLPDPLSQTCLAGGRTVSYIIGWTKDDASDCTSACEGGGCAAGPAENVK